MFKKCVVLVLLLQSVHVLAADASARQWLDRMSHSFRELNYRGSFTYEQGDAIEALQITHAVFAGKEFERLKHMDGLPREIIRRGHSLKCLHPGHRLVRGINTATDLHADLSAAVELEQFYSLSLQGDSRVAGRQAVELAIIPRDTHRYGHRLSLDKETGLVLRAVLYGSQNKVLERFQFVDIDVEPQLSPADFAGDTTYQARHDETPAVAAANNDDAWSADWLPGGFNRISLAPEAGDMQSFTDGLAVFSIFLEALNAAPGTEVSAGGLARRGATVAYSRSLLLNGAPYRVTIVGEIPQRTAERVAASVNAID